MKTIKIVLVVLMMATAGPSVFAGQLNFMSNQITSVTIGAAGSNVNSGYVSVLAQNNYYNIRPSSTNYETLSKLAADIRAARSILVRFDDTNIANEKNVTNIWINVR